MQLLRDHEGLVIQLTDRRLVHILEHPEMRGLVASIEETLASPDQVMESLSDPLARLYYRHYERTPVGAKFLCVIVKVTDESAFVLTAYLTNRVKRGIPLWPTSR